MASLMIVLMRTFIVASDKRTARLTVLSISRFALSHSFSIGIAVTAQCCSSVADLHYIWARGLSFFSASLLGKWFQHSFLQWSSL